MESARDTGFIGFDGVNIFDDVDSVKGVNDVVTAAGAASFSRSHWKVMPSGHPGGTAQCGSMQAWRLITSSM